MPEKSRIAPKAMRTLLGLDSTKYADSNSSPTSVSFIHRYSSNEKTALLSKLFVKQRSQHQNIPTGSIISYLAPTSDKVAYRADQFNKLRALAPEIEQSAIIVASSIMSPNDLKDGSFIFDFSKDPSLTVDPELADALASIYSEYFNDTLQMGKEAFNWLQDILYKDGGKAILILPPAVQQSIRDRTREDVRRENDRIYGTDVGYLDYKAGNESFSQYISRTASAEEDFLYSGKTYTWKDYLSHDTYGTTRNSHVYLEEMIPSMESFGVPIPSALNAAARKSVTDNSIPLGAMESMMVNLRTKLEDGEAIRITENPEILRFRVNANKNTNSDMRSKVASKYGINNDINRFPEEQMITLGVTDSMSHIGHPTLIKLPIESVVPVIVPGAPSEHLGYFILLDENGEPITASKAGPETPDGVLSPEGSLTNASYDAIFGDNTWRALSVNNSNVTNTGNAIFNHILDGYIKTRLSNIYGRSDLSVSRFNSLSTVLFYRLLNRKNTTVVFAYPDLLHYFAFDYHDDGTGYAKIEEIGFLISMRTSFIIANVMAMARDAVVHKKVTIGTDDANTNIEGLMDMAYNVFNAKRKFNACNVNPDDIIRDMYSDAVTIIPKNIPGLSEFSIDTESVSGGNAANVNNELIEYLSNLIASHLDVPPAALNQMAEPEYAKSLVTYNLFFAKRIMERQNVFCKQFTEFVRAYVMFDPILQRAIAKVVKTYLKKDIGVEVPSEVAMLSKKHASSDTYSTANTEDIIRSAIHNVVVKLPDPNIVMDKARFAEVDDYINIVNNVADMYFNTDIIPDQDKAASSALPILKAKYKFDMLTKFINKMGTNNIIEPPSVEDIETDSIVDYIQLLQNLNSRLSRQRTAVSNFPNDTRDNSPSSSGYDFGGDSDF